MRTPEDIGNGARPGVPMGTPGDVPDEMSDVEDRTSRVDPAFAAELPPLPVETGPGPLGPAPFITDIPLAGSPVDDLIGKHCGGYVIEALLGEGGMGKVYLANNPRLGKRAAIKVLLPMHSRSPHIVDRFLQEAKAAAQIDDPNIIDVLDASELEGGRAYLLMPYVEGLSLEDLCERMGPMPLEVAATILLQICAGLDAAHQHGIIHRDIKPHNILVGRRQHREHFVRIVDFGIAKLLDPHLAGKFRTHTKALMGTPGYMAPEQARGDRKVDSRADVYAVGVVAYRMLTGRRPYMEETLFALIQQQATDAPFPRPRELRPDLPADWDDAIMAALASDRDERLTSVRELALRLARGIPDGEQMLRMLAPQLAESPLPPHARTLDSFLDHDIARRTPSQLSEPRPVVERAGSAGSARPTWQLVLTSLILLLLGGLAGVGLRSGASSSEAPSLVASSAAPPPAALPSTGAPVSAPVAAPLPAADEPSPTAAVAAKPVEERKRSVNASSAKPPRSASAADPAPAASAAPAAPTAGSGRAAAGQLSREDSARLARLGIGVLVVKVQPWGLLTIDGVREGYAPKRKEMPAGRYVIHITTKSNRTEQVEVTVSPGKVTVIERNF